VLQCSAIDVAIIDVNTPEEELKVLAVVRRDFPAIKVIIVANGYIPLPVGPLFDAIEVLPKPVELSHIRETVHRVLGYR
jgi:hypothetical protein